MSYESVLSSIGFQKMDKNINGSKIHESYEKYHLYLRYILTIDKVKNNYYLIDHKGNSVGPIHNISSILEIKHIYSFDNWEINRMKSNYRDYQISKLGI